jgi:hypothetical protein
MLKFTVIVHDDEGELPSEKTFEFATLEDISIEKFKELGFGQPVSDKDELQYCVAKTSQDHHYNSSWSAAAVSNNSSFDWISVKQQSDLDQFRSGAHLRLIRKAKRKIKDKDRSKSLTFVKSQGLFGLSLEELINKQQQAKLNRTFDKIKIEIVLKDKC